MTSAGTLPSVSASTVSPTPTPQRDDTVAPSSTPKASSGSAAASTQTKGQGGPSVPPGPRESTNPTPTAARSGWHITLSKQEKISIAFAFGYAFTVPLFGFALGLAGIIFGVRRFNPFVKLAVWGAAIITPILLGNILATPAPSNAFQIFILTPITFAYACLGTIIYLSVLGKMEV